MRRNGKRRRKKGTTATKIYKTASSRAIDTAMPAYLRDPGFFFMRLHSKYGREEGGVVENKIEHALKNTYGAFFF